MEQRHHIVIFLLIMIMKHKLGYYWDAGQEGSGAFVGEPATHGMAKYTCTYRLIT